MAVSWYEVPVWKAVSPDGTVTDWGTNLSHQVEWEDWTITTELGEKLVVPRNVKPKYMDKASISFAYNADAIKGAVPTVALARVEYDTVDPIEAKDVLVKLDTQEKWDALAIAEPSLDAVFADQPVAVKEPPVEELPVEGKI
jgi:hypothetical protein